MVIYHGSNVEVKEPRLLEKQRDLDFGRGFYTTTDLEQAKKWAKRTARIRKNGEPVVSVYEIDDEKLKLLDVLRFKEADREWLAYVTANRRQQEASDCYDIVIGPVANDQTMPTLILYLDGYLNEDETIARLLPQKLKDQVVIKTEKAFAELEFVEVIRS